MSRLTASGLVSGYEDMMILHGVSVIVEDGEIVTIIGPNGAGKSTLMKTLFGLLPAIEGRIHFGDLDTTALPPDRLVRLGFAYVPQVANVFPSLTVRENLELGGFVLRENLSRRFDRVFDLFPALRTRKRTRVGNMSGGERQMVAMGRALMLDPRLLMLDEPTAALAPNLAAEIFEQIMAINERGISVLIVEQNAKESLRLSDRGYVLAGGCNRFDGAGMELLENEDIGKLYLGG